MCVCVPEGISHADPVTALDAKGIKCADVPVGASSVWPTAPNPARWVWACVRACAHAYSTHACMRTRVCARAGWGILVSRKPKDTCARYTVRDPSEVLTLLQALVAWGRTEHNGWAQQQQQHHHHHHHQQELQQERMPQQQHHPQGASLVACSALQTHTRHHHHPHPLQPPPLLQPPPQQQPSLPGPLQQCQLPSPSQQQQPQQEHTQGQGGPLPYLQHPHAQLQAPVPPYHQHHPPRWAAQQAQVGKDGGRAGCFFLLLSAAVCLWACVRQLLRLCCVQPLPTVCQAECCARMHMPMPVHIRTRAHTRTHTHSTHTHTHTHRRARARMKHSHMNNTQA